MLPSLCTDVNNRAESLEADLTDRQLRRRHEEIRRGLARSNTATVVALIITVGLAGVATFYAFVAEEHAAAASEAHAQRTEELWNAQLARARALRLSGKVGRRQESLQAIAQAVSIRPSPELRDEAIATLALVDIQPGTFWPHASPQVNAYGISPRLNFHALGSLSGAVDVFSSSDKPPLLHFGRTNQALFSIDFSQDEQLVAARWDSGAIEVWNLAERRRVFDGLYPQPTPSSHSVAFHPNSRLIAVACADDTIRLINLESAQEEATLATEGRAWTVAFDGEGRRLAAGVGRSILLFDAITRRKLTTLQAGEPVGRLAWHPDGNLLAVGAPNGRVVLVDARTGQFKTIGSHTHHIINVLFHPAGGLLASASWDGTTRFWDARSGRPLLATHSGYAWIFDPAGRRMGFFREGKGVGDWLVERDAVYETASLPLGIHHEVLAIDLSDDGALLAATTLESFHLLECRTGRELDSRKWARSDGVAFAENGHALLLSSETGLHRVPLHRNPETHALHFGQAELLSSSPREAFGHAYVCYGERRRFGAEGSSHAAVVDLEPPYAVRTLPVTHWHNAATVSPDGRLLCLSRWKGHGTQVWNLDTQRQVVTLPDEGGTSLFSPDGRWLLIGTSAEYLFYDTATWQVARRLPRDSSSALTGLVAFSPDSRLLATTHTLRQVRLVAPSTGETLATLDSPTQERITALSFSGDGSVLAASTDSSEIQVWNLRDLRQRLGAMRLDWEDNAPAAALVEAGHGHAFAGSGTPAFFRYRGALLFSVPGAVLALVFALYSIFHHRKLVEAYAAVEAMAATRRQQLETAQAQLLQSQKMKALGTLAAGVAHDFNNLLSIIRMSGQLVARQVKPTGVTKENLDAIDHAVSEGKGIVRSILGYSRRPTDSGAAYSVNGAVSETLSMLSKQFLGGIVLTLELDKDTPLVRGDQTRLEQVLLNLIVNAADAMQGTGKLLIRVRPQAAAPVGVLQARAASRYAEVAVRDSGPGISPEVLPRIFEPFFTTKQAGAERGTGLGLTTVYTIAQQDGWGLAVETGAGAGTTFQVWLPAEKAP